MPKTKEQKRREAVERLRHLFQEKLMEYESNLPGGVQHANQQIKGGSKEYLESMGVDARRIFLVYLAEAELDPNGFPIAPADLKELKEHLYPKEDLVCSHTPIYADGHEYEEHHRGSFN